MNDFDISYDGYTPEETQHKQQPYRPPQTSDKPYRPPLLDDDNDKFQPGGSRPDDSESKQPIPAPFKGAPGPPQRNDRTNAADDSDERERAAKERKEAREKRRRELLAKEQKFSFKDLRIVRFFKDERTRVFLAALLCISSIFVVIAVFSHFRNGAADQSVTLNLPLTESSKDPSIVNNAAGGFGAKLSYILLCDALGLGSLVLIPYMWILALALLKIRPCKFWSTTFRCLLLAISTSIVLGLITYNWETVTYWGGNHGHYVNKLVMDYSSVIGAICLSAILIAALCAVYFNELKILYDKWHVIYVHHKMEAQQRRARRQELERLEAEAKAEAEAEARRLAEAERAKAEAERAKAEAEKAKVEHTNTESVSVVPVHKPTDGISQPQPMVNDVQVTPASPKPAVKDEHIQFIKTDEETSTTTDSGQKSEDLPGFDIDPSPKAESKSDETKPADVDTKTPTTSSEVPIVVKTKEIEVADYVDPQAYERETGRFDHRAELARYQFPPIDILKVRESGPVVDMEEQQANKALIEKTLLDYKIPISRIEATVGPTVTLYEIVPAEGVRISQIKRLEDDVALSLKALGIRIIAPIPGKGTVGIEVPNKDPQTVSMRSVINSKKYQECKMALPMAMGATISNDIFIADLAKMPHLLVAGATGMGKSVGLNAIIASLLFKKHPSELKFVLVDPKMVEFSLYSKLERHYLAKLPNEEDAIITDMRKVIQTLNSLCVEMDNRYELLRNANVRSLEEYNEKFSQRKLNPNDGHKYLPYIVVIVDEFADLIMTQGKEVEQPIARIAQKARAVGIHMILATQRPSTNVITGLIKANFPGRIAFRVIQMVDSRTILDCPGANQLIGRGDMLFSHNGIMERVQCAFISTGEVEDLTEHIDRQVGYEHAYYLPEPQLEDGEGGPIAGASTERDSLFNEAARFVVSRQLGSTSSLQRQFGIGYNRAGKLMDQLEAAGIVGQVNGAKPRAILVDIVTLESMLGD